MTNPIRVLVVEDDRAERNALARLLRCAGCDVTAAGSLQEAFAVDMRDIDVAVSDLRLRNHDATTLLRKWKENGVLVPVLVVTAFGDIDTAVEAMKLGAVDYLTKPVDSNRLLDIIRQVAARRRSADLGSSVPNVRSDAGELPFIWSSVLMERVVDRIRRASQAESTVLILGESGTGKELVAQALHRLSSRSSGPFVAVNIAAIPRDLVESELFGHIKGSFTGATEDRKGKFEQATSGTLFIDEVGDFELAAQGKILRVLESRVVSPVGSNEERAVDARIIAATSRDMDRMVQDGTFREDLYYRLSVVVIEIPPLRHRREDIPVLVRHFTREIATQLGRSPSTIHPELMARLIEFDWPGNVRQLRNALESMLVMSNGDELRIEDFPAHIRGASPATETVADPESSWAPAKTLDAVERQITLAALEDCGGNRTHAAERLGISVRTLQRRLKTWGLQRDSGAEEDD